MRTSIFFLPLVVDGWGQHAGYYLSCSSGLSEEGRHSVAQNRYCQAQCRAFCAHTGSDQNAVSPYLTQMQSCLANHGAIGCSYAYGEVWKYDLRQSLLDVSVHCRDYVGQYWPLFVRSTEEAEEPELAPRINGFELRLPPSSLPANLKAWIGEPLSDIAINTCKFDVNDYKDPDLSEGYALSIRPGPTQGNITRYVQLYPSDHFVRQSLYVPYFYNQYKKNKKPFFYIKFNQSLAPFAAGATGEDEDSPEIRRYLSPDQRFTVDAVDVNGAAVVA